MAGGIWVYMCVSYKDTCKGVYFTVTDKIIFIIC